MGLSRGVMVRVLDLRVLDLSTLGLAWGWCGHVGKNLDFRVRTLA